MAVPGQDVIVGLSQQVQILQTALHEAELQNHQLRTIVAEMESREGTLMSYMLWMEERLTVLKKRLPGPSRHLLSFLTFVMDVPLLLDYVFDFFAVEPMPRLTEAPDNQNGWIKWDVPLRGEIDEPMKNPGFDEEEELNEFIDDDQDVGNEEVEEWLMAPVTPPRATARRAGEEDGYIERR
uniref:Uncharacterized protein n=1 Tax=Tanacetum cinerariifolium TaxID=118510 RepID=A0A6L2JYJ5_TANCI|nr:hypothetical protein [Tanacetum cinerariifolium]